ncbi:uncharacterized protein LOC123674780 isoform X2 [Harmonia axyridis]|uniref:uncharacterized protein LOC123674780 isoform X2 n=1 Tax=Harmonia axyridis TaxID=115357 RepID=UPI001E2768C0|nr:uncharacterized protein LOC123674780 isoform X2 [Harmonia axyridis]
MGQCMSRKAAGAFAASAAGAHNRPSKKKHSKLHQSPDDNHKHSGPMRKNNSLATKGVATSFGFRRRPMTSPSVLTTPNESVARRLASTDSNGNDNDTRPLTANIETNGRSTPRLPPPKKEGNATQGVGRFGFRQTNLQVNRSNRVADLNSERIEFCPTKGSSTPKAFHATNNTASNNRVAPRAVFGKPSAISVDNNRNRAAAVKNPAQSDLLGRFTLQATQLPRPQSIHVVETKTAKTIVNNNIMKYSSNGSRRTTREDSSKDGSSTEDSGLGSHVGTDLDISPQTPTNGINKNRTFEVKVTGKTFELREPEAMGASLPQTLDAPVKEDSERSIFQNTGLVRERTFAFEQQIEKETRRKISVTSSEGFSDGSCQREQPAQHKPYLMTQKSFLKPKPSPINTFLKTKVIENKDYSSGSSEDIEYGLGGESLADEVSVSISSSDESKDKDLRKSSLNLNLSFSSTEDKSFIKKSLPIFRPVTLTIADSTLDDAAAESIDVMLLQDETSPVEDSLLSFSDSEEQKRNNQDSSNSKDINEKPSPSTPGTPTNASNSCSLSEGKDDFLIDDEIADQPALVFGDKSQHSEPTTLIETSTPKKRRVLMKSFEGSPLVMKESHKSSTMSLDTLSPTDSFGSGDMMMDYEFSHSSIDDCEKSGISNRKKFIFEEPTNSLQAELINAVNTIETDIKHNEEIRDWSALLNCTNKSGSSRPRFIRSRTGTPNSMCQSPSSLDGRTNGRLSSTASSSLRRLVHNNSTQGGYESDDSIVKLDRSQATIKNDIHDVKTMLFKLREILNESETRNPFEGSMNGQNNGLVSEHNGCDGAEEESKRFELADLRRQVLFLQGQLEDKDRKVMSLQDQLTKMCTDNYQSNSAPASTTSMNKEMSNAATQTEKIRRLSTEPSLTNCSHSEATQGNLVSVTELDKRIQTPSSIQKMTNPVDPSASSMMYQRLSNSKAHTMIPRRSHSRTRASPSTLS